MKKLSSYFNYILLFIFLGVMLVSFFKKPDPIFLILGVIVFVTGVNAAQGLDEFGASIERYKLAGNNVIKAFDAVIEKEKKKKHTTILR